VTPARPVLSRSPPTFLSRRGSLCKASRGVRQLARRIEYPMEGRDPRIEEHHVVVDDAQEARRAEPEGTAAVALNRRGSPSTSSRTERRRSSVWRPPVRKAGSSRSSRRCRPRRGQDLEIAGQHDTSERECHPEETMRPDAPAGRENRVPWLAPQSFS